MIDITNRDRDILNQKTWNVTTYAIVVLYKGEYFGHIYAWLSPIDPSLCFAMGIRGRADSVFREDDLRNVSHYLLEGVRRFAKAKGCRTMVITHPLDVMRPILGRLNFRVTSISRTVIGDSLGGEKKHFHGLKYCINCYENTLDQTFVEGIPLVFDLVE